MKKILLTLLVALIVLTLAVSVSAEETANPIPEWTETQTLPGFTPKEGFDTTSRVMLKNSDGSYVVYPAYYILKCTDDIFQNFSSSSTKEIDFTALNAAVADTGEKYSNESVVRLEIPVGFTSVDAQVFRQDKGFISLLTLKVPEGVTSFGTANFYGTSPSIKEVEFPTSLTSIGEKFCQNQTSIRKVTLGSNIAIGNYSFDGCTALEEVVFKDAEEGFVTTIGERAFRNTTSLQTVILPDSLTTMSTNAFYGSSLPKVTIPESVTSMTSAFASCTGLKELTIKCKTVSANAFDTCSNLETLILEEGVEEISEKAFRVCSALKNVKLPKSLTTIGTFAFYNCTSLTEITIPENVSTVGDTVFRGCSALSKAIVKGSKIGASMFINDANFSVLVLSDKIASIGTTALSGVHSPLLTIYTGDDPDRLGTLYNHTKFTSADKVPYAQYLEDVKNGVVYTKDTIVYGANYCVELNGGVHQMTDEPTCTQGVECSKCGLEGASALGHNKGELEKIVYVTFDVAGDKLFDCTRCEESVVEQGGASPIFTAKGYSTNPDKNAINGGYSVNLKALELYEETNGQIEYGIVIANAKTFGGKTLFDENNEVNSSKALRVEIEGDYANFDCSIMFGENAGADLTLVICAYVIDANGVHTVQHTTGTEIENKYISGGSYKGVTLAMVIANLPSGVRNDEE